MEKISENHFNMVHFVIQGKLQSDKLERLYGPIHAQVILHNKSFREVFLLDQIGIKREYAITFFQKNLDKDSANITKKIKSGKLIGKTFRESGYDIIKKNKKVFNIELPPWLKKEFLTNKNIAKASAYEFWVKRRKEKSRKYAIIFEVYRPQ